MKSLLLLIPTLAISACTPVTPEDVDRAYLVGELLISKQAKLEFQCEKVDLMLLTRKVNEADMSEAHVMINSDIRYGVEGCGKRAVYTTGCWIDSNDYASCSQPQVTPDLHVKT